MPWRGVKNLAPGTSTSARWLRGTELKLRDSLRATLRYKSRWVTLKIPGRPVQISSFLIPFQPHFLHYLHDKTPIPPSLLNVPWIGLQDFAPSSQNQSFTGEEYNKFNVMRWMILGLDVWNFQRALKKKGIWEFTSVSR
ncbi:hypothetical protein HAX54_022819 [Datura stramonium]|uniref:Uncharacterized protein n=1 Tax=Datura stramonium TaxID=4076 RepID=A0ABS8UX27_DATST|nr:hypothetical protein [Datura stramonium]